MGNLKQIDSLCGDREAFISPGDFVVGISVSGNAKNVVKAIKYANANGAVTMALTGFDGGEIRKISSLGVHLPAAKGEYGPVEDIHLVVDHPISRYLINVCGKEKKDLK